MPLEHKLPPIISARWQRVTFIVTSGDRFMNASKINDLLDFVDGHSSSDYFDNLLGNGKRGKCATVVAFNNNGDGEAGCVGWYVAYEPTQGLIARLLRRGHASPSGDIVKSGGHGLQRDGDGWGEDAVGG